MPHGRAVLAGHAGATGDIPSATGNVRTWRDTGSGERAECCVDYVGRRATRDWRLTPSAAVARRARRPAPGPRHRHPKREWWAGEGSAVVECFGEVDAVAPALDGLDLGDSVVAVARTA